MKITTTIARYLLGALFLTFGLNGFLHFIPLPPPSGLAGQYMTLMFTSHYLVPVFLLQAIAGLLLLANRFVPVALVLLGPIIANVWMYHVLLAPSGLTPAIVSTVLWGLVFYRFREAFAPIFAMKERD